MRRVIIATTGMFTGLAVAALLATSPVSAIEYPPTSPPTTVSVTTTPVTTTPVTTGPATTAPVTAAPSEPIILPIPPVSVGAPLTVSASGFPPGCSVSFTIEVIPPASGIIAQSNVRPEVATLFGSAIANANGVATVSGTAPAGAGNYRVVATGTCSGVVLVASLATTVSGSLPNSQIPQTGSDPGYTLQVAGIAVLVGAGLVGAAAMRRRRIAA